VNADVTTTLSLPGDCATISTNPQTDIGVSLATSSPTPLQQKTWSVTCDEISSHSFDVQTLIAISPGELHALDTTGSNDSGGGQATSGIIAEANLEAVSVDVTAPTAATLNVSFDVTVDSSLLNNGPFGPVNADATVSLGIPSGCSASPSGAQGVDDISLDVSTPFVTPTQTWTLTCSQVLATQFSATVDVAIDQLHVDDPDGGNNSRNGQAPNPTGVGLADNDGDGVPDAFDACPSQLEDMDGYQDSDGCTDTDNDLDGVCDSGVAPLLDECSGSDVGRQSWFLPLPPTQSCRNVAEDFDSFHDGDGCPEPDNDQDGFPDVADDCPGTDYTAGPDGIADTGDEPLAPLPTLTKEDYDGVMDADGCHDSPGDDFDGDSLSDEDEVFIFFTDPRNHDTDMDGIEDGVDGLNFRGGEGTIASSNFTDVPGGATFGTIVDSGGAFVSVSDAPDPEGVRIRVSGLTGPAIIDACGIPLTIALGTNSLVTCGSARVEVISGLVTAHLGTIELSVFTGNTVTVNQVGPGTYSVANDPLSVGSVSVGGLSVLPGETAQNLTDEDGDGRVTAVDNCPSVATAWIVPVGDNDCDAWSSADEGALGTNASLWCSATGAVTNPGDPTKENDEPVDNWPADMDDDQVVNLSDVLYLAPPKFFSVGPSLPYEVRYDLDLDGVINLSDVLYLAPPVFFATCTP